jgi:mRNA interferase RelE/StbE
MASYSLRVKKSADKELRSVPKPDLTRLVHRIRTLASNPRPHGCEKLSGEDKYRVRQGDWRVIYEIDDAVKVVEIVKIGHRREVYR